MSRGFVIQAQTEAERRRAVALAFSLKTSNPECQTTLVCGDLAEIEEWHEEPFDSIIEYPFQNKIMPRNNDWQLWWVTPYEETIVIDESCIVSVNLDLMWDYLSSRYDLCFPDTIQDFRQRDVIKDVRYEFLNEYKLLPVYSAWFFFKKNETTMDYFKLADPYMQQYIDLYKDKFDPQHVPDNYDPNIMHSILVNDMALENVTDKNVSYIDMDIVSKYFDNKIKIWTDYLNVWARENGTVKIQNYATSGILYYKEPDFLTDEIFNGQRNSYRVQTKILREVQQQ